jgi:voltage-gated potassium channel
VQFTFAFLKIFFYGLELALPLLVFMALIIIVLGQVVGQRESWSRFDALYWSFITATTVGYGDFCPTQKLSRVLSILIAFVGLIFTGIVVALARNAASISFSNIHEDLTPKTILDDKQ